MGSFGFKSSMLDPADLNFELDASTGLSNMRPYLNSKLCTMQFPLHLAKVLMEDESTAHIRTYTLCPGFVRSELFRDFPVSKLAFWRLFEHFLSMTPEEVRLQLKTYLHFI